METFQFVILVTSFLLVSGTAYVLLWLTKNSEKKSLTNSTSSTNETNRTAHEQKQLDVHEQRLSEGLRLHHHLDGKFQQLESQFRLLQTEWTSAHRHLDHLLRRGIRLGVLERNEQQPASKETSDPKPDHSASDEPTLSRGQLLRNHRARAVQDSKPH